MKKADFNKTSLALHGVLILAVMGLGLDIYLRQTTGGGICPTEACAIVGHYIRISELNLVLLGLAFFLLLWISYFFASRYDSKWLWTGVFMLLAGALAFDGAILGFQYFSIQEQCHLCIGVGAALLTVLLLLTLLRKKLLILVLGLAIWMGGGVGGALVNIPDRAPQLEQLRGLVWSGSEPREFPRFYYFFSLHCPHCTDVLVNLAVNNPRDYVWQLLPLDSSLPDLKKITWLMKQDMDDKNMFYEVVRLEQSRDIPDVEIPQDLTHNIQGIRSFFRERGFRGVPLLIADESQGRRIIITGGTEIINYLHHQGILE